MSQEEKLKSLSKEEDRLNLEIRKLKGELSKVRKEISGAVFNVEDGELVTILDKKGNYEARVGLSDEYTNFLRVYPITKKGLESLNCRWIYSPKEIEKR